MNVYLAGPMRGHPEFNFPRFFALAEIVEGMGHDVFNPAHEDMKAGFNPAGLTGHEDLAELGFDLSGAYMRDLMFICNTADAVVVMPGWAKSKGAVAEVAVARSLDRKVLAVVSVFDEVRLVHAHDEIGVLS